MSDTQKKEARFKLTAAISWLRYLRKPASQKREVLFVITLPPSRTEFGSDQCPATPSPGAQFSLLDPKEGTSFIENDDDVDEEEFVPLPEAIREKIKKALDAEPIFRDENGDDNKSSHIEGIKDYNEPLVIKFTKEEVDAAKKAKKDEKKSDSNLDSTCKQM